MDCNLCIGYSIMKKLFLVAASAVVLAGCSSQAPNWLLKDSCTQIGCGEDLQFYPNEQFGAQRQARDWYGFEWGETSSAYPPGHPKHQELKQKEIAAGQTPWHWNQ